MAEADADADGETDVVGVGDSVGVAVAVAVLVVLATKTTIGASRPCVVGVESSACTVTVSTEIIGASMGVPWSAAAVSVRLREMMGASATVLPAAGDDRDDDDDVGVVAPMAASAWTASARTTDGILAVTLTRNTLRYTANRLAPARRRRAPPPPPAAQFGAPLNSWPTGTSATKPPCVCTPRIKIWSTDGTPGRAAMSQRKACASATDSDALPKFISNKMVDRCVGAG